MIYAHPAARHCERQKIVSGFRVGLRTKCSRPECRFLTRLLASSPSPHARCNFVSPAKFRNTEKDRNVAGRRRVVSVDFGGSWHVAFDAMISAANDVGRDWLEAVVMSNKKSFVLGLGHQKCGTSWLHKYLCQSDKFAEGHRKEFHVWDRVDIPLFFGNRSKSKLVSMLNAERNRAYKMENSPDFYFDYFVSIFTSKRASSPCCWSVTIVYDCFYFFHHLNVFCKWLINIF